MPAYSSKFEVWTSSGLCERQPGSAVLGYSTSSQVADLINTSFGGAFKFGSEEIEAELEKDKRACIWLLCDNLSL